MLINLFKYKLISDKNGGRKICEFYKRLGGGFRSR